MLRKPITEAIQGTLSLAVMYGTATLVGESLPALSLWVRVPLAVAAGMVACIATFVVIGLVIDRRWRSTSVVNDEGDEPSVRENAGCLHET